MTSARGSSELNELRYGWRLSELCDKNLNIIVSISIVDTFVCFALVAIATVIVAELVTNTWHCFTEKAEKMLHQSNDSTETTYTKLGRNRVSPGCKNCLITGDGISFFGFPKVLKW